MKRLIGTLLGASLTAMQWTGTGGTDERINRIASAIKITLAQQVRK